MPAACSPAWKDPHPATGQHPSPRDLHPHPPTAHTLQAPQVHTRGLEVHLLTPGAEDRGRQGSLGIGTPGSQPPFHTAEDPPGKPGLQGLPRGAEGNLLGGPGSMGTQGITPPPSPTPGQSRLAASMTLACPGAVLNNFIITAASGWLCPESREGGMLGKTVSRRQGRPRWNTETGWVLRL